MGRLSAVGHGRPPTRPPAEKSNPIGRRAFSGFYGAKNSIRLLAFFIRRCGLSGLRRSLARLPPCFGATRMDRMDEIDRFIFIRSIWLFPKLIRIDLRYDLIDWEVLYSNAETRHKPPSLGTEFGFNSIGLYLYKYIWLNNNAYSPCTF